MLKRMLVLLSLLLGLVSLASCGGGGGGGVDAGQIVTPTPTPAPTPAVVTKETLKIGLIGTLPSTGSMSGVSFTLFFPSDLTPLTTNGAVAANVVTASGTFAAAVQIDPVYTPAASTAAMGKMLVTLVDVSQGGVIEIGEVASITLQLASGAAPTTNKFVLSTNGVIDLNGKPITTLNAVVTDVILQ